MDLIRVRIAAVLAIALLLAAPAANGFQVVVKSTNLAISPSPFSSTANPFFSSAPIQISLGAQVSGLMITPIGSINDINAGAVSAAMTWDWGDGSQPQTTVGWPGGWSHVYSSTGTYLLTVTVADNLGNVNSASIKVRISGSAQSVPAPSISTTSKIYIVSPSIVSFANQSIYVIGIGQRSLSYGYTPYGSRMTLYYAPLNGTGNMTSIYNFVPTGNTYTIPKSILLRPGLYKISGPLVIGNVTLNQTTPWIELIDQNQLPQPLQQTFSNTTLMSWLAAADYYSLYNKTLSLNKTVADLQAKLSKSNGTVLQLTSQISALGAIGIGYIVALILSIIAIILSIIVLVLHRRSEEEVPYSWESGRSRYGGGGDRSAEPQGTEPYWKQEESSGPQQAQEQELTPQSDAEPQVQEQQPEPESAPEKEGQGFEQATPAPEKGEPSEDAEKTEEEPKPKAEGKKRARRTKEKKDDSAQTSE